MPAVRSGIVGTVTFSVSLPYEVIREGSWFVSRCQLLDVYTQGKTLKKATSNLNEAIQIFLLSCFERGTLEQVLRDCGFRPMMAPSSGRLAGPRTGRRTMKVMNIPLPFMIDPDKEHCHA